MQIAFAWAVLLGGDAWRTRWDFFQLKSCRALRVTKRGTTELSSVMVRNDFGGLRGSHRMES